MALVADGGGRALPLARATAVGCLRGIIEFGAFMKGGTSIAVSVLGGPFDLVSGVSKVGYGDYNPAPGGY